jgi:hypothetical protein
MEELLGRKSTSQRIRPYGSVKLTTWHSLSAKFGINFGDGRSIANSGQGV